ncbi:MAG: S-methyl-5-thioribose-1-phosphate isomerase [Syntrophobacterales bacterium]|jgi:methylthioribose-1-phosphate isomerase|nr:S-methyl-5-thioribose-1-phosphate isomerase [Syntrophobacterales bacterium]
MIRTIAWQNNEIHMIDQRFLPHDVRYLICATHHDVIDAINSLAIRGAPAIGIAAAMGIALGMISLPPQATPQEIQKSFHELCRLFISSRPTARNLFWAAERMQERFRLLCPENDQAVNLSAVQKALIQEAQTILDEDISQNRRIGHWGAALIQDGDNILTHCNAGSLATGGYGTALGVIRAAVEAGKKIHVFVDETRPVLQGARLTAWELMEENIPATLITDNMAGYLMSRGKIDKVIVGADRIAGNGDTANKIGTYTLAVLCREHRLPFYVAAPISTFDRHTKEGKDIPIEERDPQEVTAWQHCSIAPHGIKVFNPAFDVTPNRYISGIITEKGIARPPFDVSLGNMCAG